MDPDLYVKDGKTYTRPHSDLRRAETRHVLNGFVSGLAPIYAPVTETGRRVPRDLAYRLVAAGPSLRMNYRIVKVGTSDMLLGRPIKEPTWDNMLGPIEEGDLTR